MNKRKMLSKYRLYLKLEIVESTRVVISKKNLETIVKLCLSEFLGPTRFLKTSGFFHLVYK